MEIKVTSEEKAYREKKFPDVSKVIKEDETLKCTACHKPVRTNPVGHPLLEVLVCQKCHDFCASDFSSDEDGTDKYCRWCGQGGTLNLCSECKCAFCQKCVERNCDVGVQADVEHDDWKCFVCNVKPLWDARAYCWAVIEREKEKTKKKQLKAKSALEALKEKRAKLSTDRSQRYKDRYKSDSETDSDGSSEKYSKRRTRRKMKARPRMNNGTNDSDSENSDNEFITKKAIEHKRGTKAKHADSEELSKESIKKSKSRAETEETSSSDDSEPKEKKKKIPSSNKNKKGSESSEDSDYKSRKHIKQKSTRKVAHKKSDSEDEEEKAKASTSSYNNHKQKQNKHSKQRHDSSEQEDSDGHNKIKQNHSAKKSTDSRKKQKSSSTQKKREDKGGESSKDDEAESDATSKDGESQNESGNIEWLGGLIQDFTKYAAKNHEHLSKIQNRYSKNMPHESIQDVCKVIYKEVKNSLKFLQEYKTSIKDDYSDWRRKETKKQKRQIKKNKNKDLPVSSNLDVSIRSEDASVANEEEKDTETEARPVKSKNKAKEVPTEANESLEESIKLHQNSSAVSDEEQETPSKNTEEDKDDLVRKPKRTSSDKENAAHVENDEEPNVERNKADRKQKAHKSSKKVDKKNVEASEESDAEAVSTKQKSKLITAAVESGDSDKESKSRKGKKVDLSQDSEDENKTYFSEGEESKMPDEPVATSDAGGSVATSDEKATQEYVGNVVEDLETGSKASSENATVKKSLLTLEEEASKLQEQLSNELLFEKLNKTLSSRATRRSVDLFSDDGESIGEKSTTFNNSIIALTDSEDPQESINDDAKKILEADTVSEISNVGEKDVTRGKNALKESDEEGNNSPKNTPENILLETTQEFEENADKSTTAVKKVYRDSVATVACVSTDSDQDMDTSEINLSGTSPFASDNENQTKKTRKSCERSSDEKVEEKEKTSGRRESRKTKSVDEDEEAKKALLQSSASDSDSSDWTKSSLKSKKSTTKSKASTTGEKRKIGPKSKVVGSKGETFRERMSRKSKEPEEIISNVEEYSNDIKLNSKCFVSLVQIEEKKKGAKKSMKRKSGEDSDQEIKNLADIDSIEKPRRKKGKGEEEDDDDDKPSKPKPASKKKKKEKCESEAGSSPDDDDGGEQKINQNGQSLLAKPKSKTEDELAAEAILVSSNSDESELDSESDKKKKKKAAKSKEQDVKEEKEGENSVKKETKDDSSDSEKKQKKKRPSWKNDKLLCDKLSESETEDEEEAFKKIQTRQKKQKEQESSGSDVEVPIRKTRQKKKTGRRQAVLSDSDVQLVDSESEEKDGKKKSSSSSSDDDFWNSKKKKSTFSSDDDSSSSGGKKKAPKRKRIKKMSGSDSDLSQKGEGTPGKRKNIKKILKEKDLEKSTQSAAQEEKERKQRIADRQKLYNEMYEHQLEEGTAVKELVLDFDPDTKKTILEVHKELVAKLKPHQAQGVKFMWDALFESVDRAKKDKGSGCILAHCMGLGKTMQVVVLVHTLLAHPELELGVRTVLIVTPLSTVNNWCSEFSMWLNKIKDDVDVNCLNMTGVRANERAMYLKNWQRQGGVCVMSYDLYRNLSNDMSKRTKKATAQAFQRCLVDPGADLVVCDEGHLLKNEKSKLSESMSRVGTRRRVVLTGTPLQNNLLEYHCMIQFVKPNLLGKRAEFTNRFVNPIKNGQCADSTARDVVVMKRRAHVLHKMLEGCVQRYDYTVLTPLLKPKQEYVIKIRLSKTQIDMYGHYLNFLARQGGGLNKGASLFSDYQNLQRVWTHPLVMQMRADRDVDKLLDDDAEDSAGSLKDFIDDDIDDTESSGSSSPSNSSDSDIVCEDDDSDKGKKRKKKVKKNAGNKKKYRTRGAVADGEVSETEDIADPVSKTEWWSEFVKPEDLEMISNSNKLVMLFHILKECEAIGDKVLVFSQSLLSLDLIEHFLRKVDNANDAGDSTEEYCGLTGSWNKGQDYFRLDGQTGTDLRTSWCKIFNNPNNLRARLFLISTRAGGLGINMVGANRVILFDASWNPSNDVQSIFRVYRFGQNKPCYIYRFLAAGTMEEKIYDRQVTKLALSGRVVDEHQIDRHFNAADLEELYSFNPLGQGDDRPTMLVPKDRLLAELLKEHSDKIEDYHEHDSLLENKPEENLTEEERQMAWNDYETEKTHQENRLAMMEQAAQNQKLYMAQMAAQLKQQQLASQLPDVDMNMQLALSSLAQYYAQNNPNLQNMPGVSGTQNVPMSYEQQQQLQYMRQMQQMQRMVTAQQANNSPPMTLPLQPVSAPTPRVNQVVDLVDLSDGEQENAAATTANQRGSGEKKPKLKLREDLY